LISTNDIGDGGRGGPRNYGDFLVANQWKKGLFLSLTTAFMWGLLPIALSVVLKDMTPVTVNMYRFLFAGIILFSILWGAGRLPSLKSRSSSFWLYLFIVIGGLSFNYFFYVLGLSNTSSTAVQLLIQLAPIGLTISSIFIFKESFSLKQSLSYLILVFGLLLFFHDHFHDLTKPGSTYRMGIVFIIFAAITWISYALAQKKLLKTMGSQQILMITFLACGVILLPFSVPEEAFELDMIQVGCLVFCIINTNIAYGAFSEAMLCWEASRVSAVLSLVPLITLGLVAFGSKLFPDTVPVEYFDWINILGASLVVFGSMGASLTRVVIKTNHNQ